MAVLGTRLGTLLGTTLGTNLLGGPDAILDQITGIGGPPSYQFRADTVTLSGGNVATIPNRRGSDALVLAAGTLAAPASDALFGGAPSIVFSGTQWLDSNLAASAWKFLHDGTGCEAFLVFTATGAGTSVMLSTFNNSATNVGFDLFTNAGGITTNVGNGSTTPVANADASGGPANTAGYANIFLSSTTPQTSGLFTKDVGKAFTTAALSLSSSNPAVTLRLGALGSNAAPASMRFAELLIFPRVLHEYERQIVREYIAARYGIAAPSLTGVDRDIMSMLPWSWARADYYSIATGKVTAFGDKARPGHTYTQGSSSNQISTPANDANFNNQLVGTFSNAFYDSSLAAASWAFLHNGNGSYFRHVYKLASTSSPAIQCMHRTTDVGTQNGSVWHAVSSGSASAQAFSTTTLFNVSAFAADLVAAYVGASFRTADTPDYTIKKKSSTVASGDALATPSAGAPKFTLRLGGFGNNNFTLNGQYAESIFFDRVLSAAEESRLQAYYQSRYGIAP